MGANVLFEQAERLEHFAALFALVFGDTVVVDGSL